MRHGNGRGVTNVGAMKMSGWDLNGENVGFDFL